MANRVQLTIGADDEATVVLRKVQAELGRLGVSAEKAGTGINRATAGTNRFSGALSGAGRLLGALGLAVTAAELVQFANAAVNAADDLAALSEQTGVAVESLSVLSLAAEQSGKTAGDLSSIFSRLSKAVEELREGNEETTAAFAAMGLAAKDFDGLSLDESLVKIADAQVKFADGAGKSNVLMTLLGRSGAELIPLLNSLANDGFGNLRTEMERTGAVMSTETARKADELNDRLAKLKASATVLGAEFTLPLKGAFVTVAEAISDATRALARWIDLLPQAARGGTGTAVASLFGLGPIAGLREAARLLEQMREGGKRGDFADVVGGSSSTAPDRPELRVPKEPSATKAARQKSVKDDAEREARERAQALDAVMRAEAELDELRGKGIFAATEATRIWAREYENNLRKIGASQAEIDSKVAAALATRFDADEYADAAQRAEQAFNELATDRLRIQQQADRGLISQAEAERQILELERARVPVLNSIADAMAATGARLGDPALIEAARRLRTEINGLGVDIDESAVAMANLGSSIEDALRADLSQFLGSTINEVNGIGDALVKLASAAAQSVQRIVGDILATMIVDKAKDLLGIGAQTAAATATTASAAALTAAGTTVTAGAVATGTAAAALGTAGGVVAAAAAAMTAAAAALAAARVGGLGLASGGFVSGPGSATSDSIPAWLSNGEYVINAAAVRRVGLDQLNAINFGMSRALIPRTNRFAAGGLVTGAALSSGGGSSDVVELRLVDEMLEARVLDTLGSGEGRRVQVRNLSRDARKSGRALDR
jgi:ribosomal protein S20